MAAVLATVAWISACDWGADPDAPDSPVPTTVTVTPATAQLTALRATLQMTAEVRDQHGDLMSGADVAWDTRVPNVAGIDTAGVISAESNGTDTITATAGAAVGTAVVTVVQTAALVAVTPAAGTLAREFRLRLIAEAVDANGHPLTEAEFEWASKDTSVAVVDESGQVEGVAPGAVSIIASVGNVEGMAEITVVDNLDRGALTALYHSTGGASWKAATNWLDEGEPGSWYGVATDANGRVVALNLAGNDLAGTLPPELAYLTRLRTLILSENSLVGPIPAELGNLTSLETVDLRSNHLTGPMPAELGNLTSLQVLRLGSNWLSGSIPAELGRLADLIQLHVRGNLLEGPIPPELAMLESLEQLYVNGNQLTGRIPPELARIPNLVQLDLGDNTLQGPIPPELLSLPGLLSLGLQNNLLEGRIPSRTGRAHDLQTLHLHGNNLTGPIPESLSTLSRLRVLRLSDNQLTGPIPERLGMLSSLQVLRLSENQLTGPIPERLGMLSRLRVLRLSDNQLTGPVPPEIGNLRSLTELNVVNNAELSGPLPRSFTSLAELELLRTVGTDLCAPADTVFRGWLDRVLAHRTMVCGAAEAGVYLTQAVQSLEYPVSLVSGEDALLRVFVVAKQSTSETIPDIRATFHRGGRQTHEVVIPGKPEPIPTSVDESSLSKSANVMIPGEVIKPGLEMVIEIDPDGTLDPELGLPARIPETGRLEVGVRNMMVLDLTVIPYLWVEDPDSSILELTEAMAEDPEGHEMLEDARTLLPVGKVEVTRRSPRWANLNHAGWLLLRTELLRRLEGGAGHYLGTMAGEVRGASGIAYVGGRSSFSIPVPWIIAHELGHNMNLWHAACGEARSPDPYYPYRDGTIGAWGYDYQTEALISPRTADLLSYCEPRWISGSRMA